MKFEFVAADTFPTADTVLAVPAFEGALGSAAAALDEQLGGMIAKAVAGSRFTGGAGQTLDIVAPHGLEAARSAARRRRRPGEGRRHGRRARRGPRLSRL